MTRSLLATTRKRCRRGETGLTLVELMVAMVISGIAISAALAMGYSMMNSYGDHRRTSRVMRAARASLDILSNAIRNTSPANPSGVMEVSVQDDAGGLCRGGTINAVTVNNTALNQPDELTLVYSAGGVVTSLLSPFGTDSTQLEVDSTDGFRDNDLAMIVDIDTGTAALVRVNVPDSPIRVLDFGTDPDTDGSTGTVSDTPTTIGCPLANTFPGRDTVTNKMPSLVIRVRAETFTVADYATSGRIPRLMVDPFGDLTGEENQPMALGIEDMQIAIGVDGQLGAGFDGTLTEVAAVQDDDEWVYNCCQGGSVESDPVPHNLSNPATGAAWRALRISLTAKSIEEVSTGGTAVRPAAEDRQAAPLADRYRRRQLRTTVELRNMSP